MIQDYTTDNTKKTGARAPQGFTLIETLIAISLLLLAVIAPMSLTTQSLISAYYARDQMTASNLAQEAIEAVRSERDHKLLEIAINGSLPAGEDIFGKIPKDQDFTIDTTNNAMNTCPASGCPPLQTDGTLYGYRPPRGGLSSGTDTVFTRTVRACFVQSSGSCSGAPATDEMRITVTVTWRTGSYPKRTIVIYENLYRWVSDSPST
jgi:prepilin-type N-terminal cleavage/methylation domain-containing protein